MRPDVGVWESCKANVHTRCCWLWIQYVFAVISLKSQPDSSAIPTVIAYSYYAGFHFHPCWTLHNDTNSVQYFLTVRVAKWRDVIFAPSANLTNCEVASGTAVRTNFNIWVQHEKNKIHLTSSELYLHTASYSLTYNLTASASNNSKPPSNGKRVENQLYL